jgi:hypothetical protein
MTSGRGIALLRQTDRRLGLTKALAKLLPNPRDPVRIEHPLLALVRQRVYGLAPGLRGPQWLRHVAPRSGLANRRRARPAAGFQFGLSCFTSRKGSGRSLECSIKLSLE